MRSTRRAALRASGSGSSPEAASRRRARPRSPANRSPKSRAPPLLPDQAARLDQRLLVEHVQRDDPRALSAERSRETCIGLPALHGDEIDEPDRLVGLLREVAAEIGLVHRRDRMARHGRVPVEPVSDAVAPVRTGCRSLDSGPCRGRPRSSGSSRRPGSARDVDRPPDGADMRGGVEGRADLVMRDRRAERRAAARRPAADCGPSMRGSRERAMPAMPMHAVAAEFAPGAPASAVRGTARCPGRRRRATSIAADEPVKSSP